MVLRVLAPQLLDFGAKRFDLSALSLDGSYRHAHVHPRDYEEVRRSVAHRARPREAGKLPS
jgi:hypothetical protein